MDSAATGISPSWEDPRVLELRDAYERADVRELGASLWTKAYVRGGVDPARFRGESEFLWQRRDGNGRGKYKVTLAYLEHLGRTALLDAMIEDGSFGAPVYSLSDRLLSRDKVDSTLEIDFLDRELGLLGRPGVNVLDIGAGYGRLAYRMAETVPSLGTYTCVDAVPESTYLSEWYLRWRGVSDRCRVVPLHELATRVPESTRIDLALNVHSFSECPAAAVGFWLSFLAARRVPHLFVVPNPGRDNGARILSTEPDRTRIDITDLFASHGYERVRFRPKYMCDFAQRWGVSATSYHLFARRA